MPLRFRKSFRIAPGFKINIGKSGVSSTFGKRGASVNIGKRGVRTTVGVPGTGLSWSQKVAAPRVARPSSGPGCLAVILLPFTLTISLVDKLLGAFSRQETAKVSAPADSEGAQLKANRSNPFKVVLIIIVAFIGLCMFCVAGSFAMDALGLLPTNTPSPTATSTLPATPTPLPTTTETPAPTIDAFIFELSILMSDYQDAYIAFQAQHRLAADDLTLILDDEWKLEMAVILVDLRSAAKRLGSMDDVPPKYAELDGYMKKVSAETEILIDNYVDAIDNLNQQSILKATENLQNITTYLNQALDELNSLNSQ